MKLVQ
jgi:hypothetical protein